MRPLIHGLLGLSLLCPVLGQAATIIVQPDGNGDYPTIQEALDAAADGDVIELMDGVFGGDGNRDLSYEGKSIHVRGQSGDPALCVIDCGGSVGDPHRAVTFESGESSSAILEAVTVINGYLDTVDTGIIECTSSSPTLRSCVFRDHQSGNSRIAVVHGTDASPTLVGCVIESNQMTGLRFQGGSPLVVDGVIRGNDGLSSGQAAGAIDLQLAEIQLLGCSITGNSGGACGGIWCFYSDIEAESCTIAGNTGGSEAGGIHLIGASMGTISRTIFWDNCSQLDQDLAANGGAQAALSCCDVDPSRTGGVIDYVAGNFFSDPMFCDPSDCSSAPTTEGVYALHADSPCTADQSPCGLLVGALGSGCQITDVAEGPGRLQPVTAHPNPFLDRVRLSFDAVTEDTRSLTLYSMDGRAVLRSEIPAGAREVEWDGIDRDGQPVPSGLYYVTVDGLPGASRVVRLR